MSTISVYLDNQNNGNTVYAGQAITGRVECDFNKDKGLNAIQLKFKGKARTQWTESESYYDYHHRKQMYRNVNYYGDEVYLDVTHTLFQGENNAKIPAGKHTYPFSYILPSNIPSSFEGSYGSIRYYVKAIVDRSWKFNYEDKLVLKVVSSLDLNSLPELRDPLATSLDKTISSCCCCCYDSGVLTFNVSLPATGFVPGQKISIGAHVQNMSTVTVENIKFKIVKTVRYITRYPATNEKSVKTELCSCMEGAVGAHGEKSWTSTLTIPTNQHYPNFASCGLMNATYRLQAKVTLPFPHSNLDYKVPITIGAVPLSGVTTNFAGAPPPPPVGFIIT